MLLGWASVPCGARVWRWRGRGSGAGCSSEAGRAGSLGSGAQCTMSGVAPLGSAQHAALPAWGWRGRHTRAPAGGGSAAGSGERDAHAGQHAQHGAARHGMAQRTLPLRNPGTCTSLRYSAMVWRCTDATCAQPPQLAHLFVCFAVGFGAVCSSVWNMRTQTAAPRAER